MLSERDLQEFIERMSLAMRQAGYVAKSFQGKVLNEEKSVEGLPGDIPILPAMRAAKTVVDEVVQEILLIAALSMLNLSSVIIDVEEKTPSTKQFTQVITDMTLVIDPVDGTLEYIQGFDKYSICMGLIDNGSIVSALVFFPGRDHFYFLDRYRRAFLAKDAYTSGLTKAVPLAMTISEHKLPVIYKNSRVSATTVKCVCDRGYKVFDDTDNQIGCPDAILKCISGESIAYISHTRQTRDILLGAIISGIPGGYAFDWKGQTLKWPQQGGRVPRAIFGIGPMPVALLNCLANGS